MPDDQMIEEKCAYVPPGGTQLCGWSRWFHEDGRAVENSEGWTHRFVPPITQEVS